MTEEEYFQTKKRLRKEIDNSVIRYFNKEITVKQHQKLIATWKKLIEDAKQETWFKHI